MKTFILNHDITIAYVGPPPEAGPLPALFYFALSAEDSLMTDPFNQPVEFLKSDKLRIFSLTLLGHENKNDPTKALFRWANEIEEGHDFVAKFVSTVSLVIDTLVEKDLLIEGKIGVAGLSRGGFIATHLAAKIPSFKFVLAFAPLTQLKTTKEFHHLTENSLALSLDLERLSSQLLDKKIRFYMGNRDVRVNTRYCFDFIEKLTDTAFHNNIRSPQVELILSPSIGYQGHGTPKEIFHQGANWMGQQLGVVP